MSELGYLDGETCGRNGCDGVIVRPATDCSCHISAPCSGCTSVCEYCPECGWGAGPEHLQQMLEELNDYTRVKAADGLYMAWKPRELDPSRVDWHSYPHSGCSMIKRGVYPDGVTISDVRKLVDGTFGGRFNYFRDGVFEFIAYTD